LARFIKYHEFQAKDRAEPVSLKTGS